MKSIAIIGTNGIPSKYGGFETLVEYLVKYLSGKFEITVFCSTSTNSKKLEEINGCKLQYISLRANGWQSIPYDILSLFKSYRSFDKILILGASGTIVLPFFKTYRSKFILNFGGLDWQRSKWGFLTRKFLKRSEAYAIKYSDYIISDNIGIQEYIEEEYSRSSILITYGGDQVSRVIPKAEDYKKYPFLENGYAFSVARIQPDNNIDIVLDAFKDNPPMPFILVGNWQSCSYGIKTKIKYQNYPDIILLDAIYDHRELNLLRSNCKLYIHGHSAGGTNPALVEAMNLSLPIFAYDCIFNRYTTNFKATYFSGATDLAIKIKSVTDTELIRNGEDMLEIAKDVYQWEKIANKYSEVINQ